MPVWDLTIGNGYDVSEQGLISLGGGGAFVSAGVSGGLSVGGVRVPPMAAESGLSILLARVSATGSEVVATLAPVTDFKARITEIEASLLRADGDSTVVAVGLLDFDPSTITLRNSVEIRRFDVAARVSERAAVFARADANVRLVAAGPNDLTPWIVLRVSPDHVSWPDDPHYSAVLRVDPEGRTLDSWILGDTIEDGLESVRDIVAATSELAFIDRQRDLDSLGLSDDSFELGAEVTRLEPLREPVRWFIVSGSGQGNGTFAAAPDGSVARCHLAFGPTVVWSPELVALHRLPAPADLADVAIVVARPDGSTRARHLALDGIQGAPTCAFARDGTVLLTASTSGSEPAQPGRDPLSVDQDMLVVALEPEALEVRWMLRYGDGGAQYGTTIAPTDDGFLVAGRFSGGLNVGHGLRRSRSGSDLFLARFRMPGL